MVGFLFESPPACGLWLDLFEGHPLTCIPLPSFDFIPSQSHNPEVSKGTTPLHPTPHHLPPPTPPTPPAPPAPPLTASPSPPEATSATGASPGARKSCSACAASEPRAPKSTCAGRRRRARGAEWRTAGGWGPGRGGVAKGGGLTIYGGSQVLFFKGQEGLIFFLGG